MVKLKIAKFELEGAKLWWSVLLVVLLLGFIILAIVLQWISRRLVIVAVVLILIVGALFYFALRKAQSSNTIVGMDLKTLLMHLKRLQKYDDKNSWPIPYMAKTELVIHGPRIFKDDEGRDKVKAYIIVAPKEVRGLPSDYARWVYYKEWDECEYDDDSDIMMKVRNTRDLGFGLSPFIHSRSLTFARQDQGHYPPYPISPWGYPPQQTPITAEEEK